MGSGGVVSDIRCPRCQRLLAKQEDGRIEIQDTDKSLLIFKAEKVEMNCSRCRDKKRLDNGGKAVYNLS